MKIQLIEGSFGVKEAIEIITQMIHVKIRFHEDKIDNSNNEEDVKMREKKIKNLQKDLYEFRKEVESIKGKDVSLNSVIEVLV
jgi:rubrerythrin